MKDTLDYFAEISRIPRGSGNMEGIVGHICSEAEKNGLVYEKDKARNVLVRVPGTPGKEEHEAIMLQGHMDMVAVKTAESAHDFLKDPIELVFEGDVLHAKDTTLGADDGIALAVMLRLMNDRSLEHPPLELLFTADEEIGMVGAGALDLKGITAKKMINLDNGCEGLFVVSCAGGTRLTGRLPFDTEIKKGFCYELSVQTEKGGHSGTEIHRDLLNASKVLFRVLSVMKKLYPISLASMTGGNMENAIPKMSRASLLSPVEIDFSEILFLMGRELKTTEDQATVSLSVSGEKEAQVLTEESFSGILRLLLALPNGLISYSEEIPGLTETSLNMGVLYTDSSNKEMVFRYNIRSSVNEKKDRLTSLVTRMIRGNGGIAEKGSDYPGWPYRKDSELREKCLKLYEEKYTPLSGRKPKATAIHAGLECGIIGGFYPDMDMISMGSDTPNVHSVREKLMIGSFNRQFDFICDLLKEF